MSDQVAESCDGDDRKQDELDDDPTLTAGTECREPSVHAQMVRLNGDGRLPRPRSERQRALAGLTSTERSELAAAKRRIRMGAVHADSTRSG